MTAVLILAAILLLGVAATSAASTGNGGARSRSFLAFAEAIATAEGFGVPGAIPTVRNNPGNLKLTGDQITTFATAEDGWAALYRQLELMRDDRSSYYRPTMTIAQAGQIWVGSDPAGPWVNNVVRSMQQDGYNVSGLTTLADVLA
jgi:hypothetical protein